MNIIKNSGMNVYKIILYLFTVYLVIFTGFFVRENSELESDKDGLYKIEYIHSETQRLSKLELENIMDDDLIEILDSEINRLFLDDTNTRYFNGDLKIFNIMKNIVDDWEIYVQAIEEFREYDTRDELFLASEVLYDNLQFAVDEIKNHISNCSNHVKNMQMGLIINIIIAALLLLKLLFDTGSELKKNKELSKDMYIDMATGVYNSSKCKEILTLPINQDDENEVAILIFDLNDLKKTNDLYGHQAGDSLISSFVDQLNKATEMFKAEPFIGRYGGDEFVVYFESTTEDDVKMFIEKVYSLMQTFNDEKERNFKISCAVGYCITTKETKSTTIQQLFDVADENMYNNKIAMKEKRKKELEEQQNKEK